MKKIYLDHQKTKVKQVNLVIITGALPKAGTGHKMRRVSVFSKLHC